MDNPMHDLDKLDVRTIEIENHEYKPSELTAKEGEVIKIVNKDDVEHTLTANDGEFDIEIEPGKQDEFYPPDKGVYPFYCRYHESMKGKITVE